MPWDRVDEFKQIMHNDPNEYDRLLVARLLTDWGNEDGLRYLESYVRNLKPDQDTLMPHRLRGYDDTCTQILRSIRAYWATKFDQGCGCEAQERIYSICKKLILLSNVEAFEINVIFWFVDDGMTEYLPLLKEHLSAIIKEPEKHHWKAADAAHFLMKYDPNFVEATLAEYGKTLKDFPCK
nr:hypothetical protein [uncultured Deefgea sp.]